MWGKWGDAVGEGRERGQMEEGREISVTVLL